MQKFIQAVIYHGESYYIAECVGLSVVTQGKTLDEAVQNLREAVALHLEGEDLSEMGLEKNPTILITFAVEPVIYA